MTMYTNIPAVNVAAGVEWDADDVQIYIVDNLNYLNGQIGGGSESFAVNEVIIGVAGGLDGVALADQAILVGSSGAPVALSVGTGFLRAVSGQVSYGEPDVSISAADYVKYA